jgi:DNA-binding FadR family transcriptional regulator
MDVTQPDDPETTDPVAQRRAHRRRRPARLASVIFEALGDQIIGGVLAEGDVLPTEPALCEEFGFSRTVVREGLKLLEGRGLVRVEQGRGTTVQPRGSWDLLDPDVLGMALAYDTNMALLDNLMTVRRVLEREMAATAAGRLSEADLAELDRLVVSMESVYDDYSQFRVLDNAFHEIVMRASGNEVGLTIVRVIHRYGGARPPLAATPASKATLKRTAAEHRAIVDALSAGDGERAGELISAHIEARWAERRRARKTGGGVVDATFDAFGDRLLSAGRSGDAGRQAGDRRRPSSTR